MLRAKDMGIEFPPACPSDPADTAMPKERCESDDLTGWNPFCKWKDYCNADDPADQTWQARVLILCSLRARKGFGRGMVEHYLSVGFLAVERDLVRGSPWDQLIAPRPNHAREEEGVARSKHRQNQSNS